MIDDGEGGDANCMRFDEIRDHLKNASPSKVAELIEQERGLINQLIKSHAAMERCYKQLKANSAAAAASKRDGGSSKTQSAGKCLQTNQNSEMLTALHVKDLAPEEDKDHDFFDFLPEHWFLNHVARFGRAFQHWVEKEYLPPPGIIHTIIVSPFFQFTVLSVIIANAVFTASQVENRMQGRELNLPLKQNVIELLFICAYVIELSMKFYVHRFRLFVNHEWRWNLFDFFIVFYCIGDEIVEASMDLGIMRSLRVIKLSRVLRIFRMVRFFREMRLMTDSIGNSFTMLFWCLVMLSLIIFACNLCFLQGASSFKVANNIVQGSPAAKVIDTYCGGLLTSMVELYKASTGGADWGEMYAVVAEFGDMYSLAFLFYIAFFTFSLFNILTGIVVDNVISQSSSTGEDDADDFRNRKVELREEVRQVFGECGDAQGLSWEEFMEALNTPRFLELMVSLELDIKNCVTFFAMLLRGRDRVSPECFADACMRYSGTGGNLDFQVEIQKLNQIYSMYIAPE